MYQVLSVSHDSTSHPVASSFVGVVSVIIWICVYQPQLYICYKSQSGEGLSLVFLGIWLLGDLTNLLGGLGQNLLPTMIILALYYSVCDVILIGQVFYYRRKRLLYPELFLSSSSSLDPTESDPLLSALEGEKESSHWRTLALYAVGVFFLSVAAFSVWVYTGKGASPSAPEKWDTTSQVLGWLSAFLYLGSRLPQIAKNRETKCKGLSLLMFAFAAAGNLTYVASVVLQSRTLAHLAINASWLLGSGGTIFLDGIVLSQFYWYSKARKEEEKMLADAHLA